MRCFGIPCSSINFAQYLQQNFVGILCIFGSCLSAPTAASYAKYKGAVLFGRISWNLLLLRHSSFVTISFNVQIVEPFTAHYVFALGIARFLSCAHWVLQVCLFVFNKGPFRFVLGHWIDPPPEPVKWKRKLRESYVEQSKKKKSKEKRYWP